MDTQTLLAISPLDGRYHDKLAVLQHIFSEYGLIKHRVVVEVRWLECLLQEAKKLGLTPLNDASLDKLSHIIKQFSEDNALRIKNIEKTINHDVKAVEYFIKEQFNLSPELVGLTEFIHFGCTSEDINNLAYSLMLKNARDDVILPMLDTLIKQLRDMAHTYAEEPMLARTHGQPASPTTVGKEIANIVSRLNKQREKLLAVEIMGKLNGASGNYNAFVATYPDINWQEVSEKFIKQLNLQWNPYTTQIEPHDFIAEFFHVLIRINTILLDCCRDMWGYISLNYFHLKSVQNEVGSSTMPHKINPIDFENAEGNLGISNALLEHMAAKLPISRWQRDLSDSTVLRNMGVAIAHSLLAYQSLTKGLEKIAPNKSILQQDLAAHWEVLAEPIQTVMRRHGIEQPYEKLKAFTRGKPITKELMQQFIRDLPLDAEVKNQLLQLTPETYIGYASDLAKGI